MKNEWVTLNIDGPVMEINRDGQIRQKEMKIRGTWHYDVLRKPSQSRGGYCYINVAWKGKKKNHYIHRLVASTFIPNPENKPFVNHIDGNKENNTVQNLEWVTASENSTHAVKNGLVKVPVGGGPSKTLTEEERQDVLNRIERGEKQTDIAERYNVTKSLISHIKAGRR